MKNILFFGFAIFVMLIHSCAPKEKHEEIPKNIDSVIVESNTIDTTAILTEISEEENIIEEVKQVQKEEIPKSVTKNPGVTKIIEKEVVKTTTESKPVIKVDEVVKKEVIVEKVVETKKEAEAVVEVVKTAVNNSGWVVPAKDKILKNPTANNKENSTIGKEIYSLHCKSCHGTKGLGDGPKAKSMKGDLGDFSSATFQSQTDGELFYKTKVGRSDMPSFAKKLSDEDIWLTVLYMRSLKK
ncbi:MAG: c-type cytochrome [Flavobacteriaceae bacterium]|nr:c-type cytochrome [Flavobacteriaceae bacterium]